MSRHNWLYFADGTLTLQARDSTLAADGTLFNVYRHHLIAKSGFFSGMLTLPSPNQPTPTLKASNGTSDTTAVPLPPNFTTVEYEKFLNFIFNIASWSPDVPLVADLCAILKTSHFFAVESGVEYAVHFLEAHANFPAPMQFRMGCDYSLVSWVTAAFDDLMAIPVNDITPEDEELIGNKAFRALALTQAEVTDHRMSLAVCPPLPTHATWCRNQEYCQTQWDSAWTSMAGPLGWLIKEELSGAEIYKKLDLWVPAAMTGECRLLTCARLELDLTKEEAIIDRAVGALIKLVVVVPCCTKLGQNSTRKLSNDSARKVVNSARKLL
ncbi:hypothetical protein B0H16DRAFT_1737425 [Mycena metata]|uniref:BTB domain-containing protein n=2 Tax=Mycena metata TaxID=1033252 RepID=A0AAD7HKX0_9AGAR|nr:hypothetical protein B0H16DRAFT_1737425 [Mycena metata]